MNKNSSSDISTLATGLDFLIDISIYSSSATQQPVNEDCLQNNGLGECSTICLPTQSGRTCTCNDGVSLWPNSNVCQDSSSTQQEEEVTPAPEGEKTSVALVAGVVVGVVVVLIVTVIVCLMRRRSTRKTPMQEKQDIELPSTQGLSTTRTRAYGVSASTQSGRPGTTYDYIELNEPGPVPDERDKEGRNRRKDNVFTTMAESLAPPGEYDILNRARTDYDTLDCDTLDYLEPITAKKVVKMTNLD